MEKENFDFYQEALKAFDAPIPEPKKEEPAPEPVAEVTESTPQEKPKRKFNPWWAVAICAILCLALVVGFGRERANEIRGENYIYGDILEYGEGYIMLDTGKENWYVELEGLEAPTSKPNNLLTSMPTQYIWVFYNGEPEETDYFGCTRKIKATFWKTEEGLYASQDEIEFDLDGDGRKEIWSVRYTMELPSLYASSFVNRLNLTAKDAQGNILHSVSVQPPATQSAVFSDAGGKLSVVLYQYGIYVSLDIRLENGELAVYRDGEAMKLYSVITGPLMTLPPTEPEVPTIGAEKEYTIQFFLNNLHSNGVLLSEKKLMTAEDGATLKARLDRLNWDVDDVAFDAMGNFVMTVDDRQYSYSFSHDRLLMHDGQKARISTDMMEMLLELMGWEMPKEQMYLSNLESGAWGAVSFYDDGRALLKILTDLVGADEKAYLGRYATFGDYYYLALGEKLDQVLVLRRKEYSFEYVAAMSEQNLFRASGQLEFRMQDLGGGMSLTLRDSKGVWNGSTDRVVLGVIDVWRLRSMLEACDWQVGTAYTDDEVLGYFTIFDGTGKDAYNPVTYFLLTGGRLLSQPPPGGSAAIATVDEEVWKLLIQLLSQQTNTSENAYSGIDQDGRLLELQLCTAGNYDMTAQFNHEDGAGYTHSCSGYYIRVGACMLLLGWDNGPYLICLDVLGDKLVYDAARSTPDTAFGQTTEVTLTNLQLNLHDIINLEFSMLDEETGNFIPYGRSYVTLPRNLTKEICLVLNSVQWVKLEQGVSGIWMGSFGFVDSKDPWVNVYSGMRLTQNGYEAKLTEQQWLTVCRIMSQSSGTVYTNCVASAGDVTYQLNITSGGYNWFNLGRLEQEDWVSVEGSYSLLEPDLLLCYGYSGEVFVLRKEEAGWRLLPGYNSIEIFDIPENILFTEPVVDILPEEDAVPA